MRNNTWNIKAVMRMKKPILFGFILLFSILLINFSVYFSDSKAATTDLNNFSVTGEIRTGISNLYVTEEITYDLFTTGNSSHIFPKVKNMGHINMTLAGVGVVLTDLQDTPYTKVVANNLSSPQSAVPETAFDTPRARMAQYFSIDNFSLVQKVRVYISATIAGVLLPYGHFQIDIFNASDFGGGPINVGTHSTTLAAGIYNEWIEISINEYLPVGEYFTVFSSWVTGLLPSMNNNSWRIHDYSNPVYNKGLSLFENSSGWFAIPADNTADFLLEVVGVHYLSPYEVNLSAYLNNQPLAMRHNSDFSVKTPQLGKPIWQCEVTNYLDSPPLTDAIVNVTINRTVGARYISIGGRYIYDEPTTGTFFANSSTIRWDVNYKKVNSSNSLLVFFSHPKDWSVTEFRDAYGYEIIEYGIYYSYIYGEYAQGLLINDGGDGTQTFEYTAKFVSPNYLVGAGGLIGRREVYVGELFSIQANVRNTAGEFITDGNCSFYLFDPTGAQIYTSNKTNTNGVVISDELDTNGWVLGDYSMVVYWNNGKEAGIAVFNFEISLSPLIIIGIIAAIAIAATAIVLTYGRRKLAERNWQKSLQHLLVISKSGAPMYSFSFGMTLKDSALISGMISAITNFMKETTGSERQLRIIDQEDHKIILSHGEVATAAILTKKDLPIIHHRAKQFIADFESIYRGKIKAWTGDADIFKGANKIVEEHFPVEMKAILIAKAGFQLQKFAEMVDSAIDKSTILEILSEVTNLTEKYQDLILKNYGKLINKIINTAHTKLSEGNLE